MTRKRGGRGLAAVAACMLAWSAAAPAWADDKPVDLLRVAGAKVERTTSHGDDAKGLAALSDGDPATVATAAATEAAPLDVVFSFGTGDGTVSPERVRVVLPEKAEGGAGTGRVEVLVSTLSANAGYRSVRSDPLEATAKPQEFAFPPTAARWILLRFTPAPQASRVAVATVEVLGHEGPPATHYAFAESPAKAFDVLARLAKSSSAKIAVTPDEAALFAKAREGPLDVPTFTEAALMASGILDAAKRRAYVARIDALEREARKAVEGKRTLEEKGEALLRFLHRGPMAKGYVSGQTDLSAVLDSAKFNCVSSAVLFDVLALRLGLDARAVEVPDHAFAVVYDGTRHMDVETTTPDGFNPARNPAAVAAFQKETGFRYIPDAHRDQRREVGMAGLAAIVYYNHGVQASEAKRYHEALVAYFRAMSLDGEFSSAVKNALAVLANWSGELAKGKAFEEALNVVTTGLALAPKDAALVNNHAFVWSEWARSHMEAGEQDAALAVLKRANEAIPDGRFLSMQAWVFIRPGEALADTKRWEEALAATEAGLSRLEGKPLEDLREWRVGLHLRWFGAAVQAKDFEQAGKALDHGIALAPEDRRLRGNASYLAQEWTKHAGETAGEAKALEVGRALVARYPGNPDVARTVADHVRRTARALAEKGRHEEALAAIAAGKDLFADAEAVRDARVFVWDGWAKDLMKREAWAEAADVYVRALEDAPGQSLLVNNVGFLAQEWTKAAYAKGGDAETAKVGEALKAKFPQVPAVAGANKNQVRRVVNDLVREGKFEEALAALDGGASALGDDAREVSFFVHDAWARKAFEAGDGAKAADVYAKALQRFPDDGRITGNVAYLAQEWAKAAQASGGPEKAAEALRTVQAKFPALDELKRVAKNHVGRVVGDAADAGKYDDALALLDASRALLSGASDEAEVAARVFDRWASAKRKAKDWQGAVDAYAKALERYPESDHLKRNAVATWDAWAKSFFPAKDWDAAIGVYDQALARFPGHGVFEQNRKYCAEQKAK